MRAKVEKKIKMSSNKESSRGRRDREEDSGHKRRARDDDGGDKRRDRGEESDGKRRNRGADEEEEITTSGADLQVFPTFDAMGLKEDLLRGIYSYGKLISNRFKMFPVCKYNFANTLVTLNYSCLLFR